MATVVNIPRDERNTELGIGVGNFLNNLRERRLDRLQQTLMDEISDAPDEATAAALFADPRFQPVVTDPQRFANLTTYYGNAVPQSKAALLYDDNGEQQFVKYDPRRETIMDAAQKSGFHASPARSFVAVPGDDSTAAPVVLQGRFRSQEDAVVAAKEQLGEDFGNMRLLDEAQAGMLFQATQIAQNNREHALRKRVAEYNMNSPYTAFAQLIEDHRKGRMNDVQFTEAWEYMTTKFGKTMYDRSLREITEEGLAVDAAMVTNLSRIGHKMIDQITQDPGMLTNVAGMERFVQGLGAEISELASIFSERNGLTADVNDPQYAEWFTNAGFAAKSAVFKQQILNVGLIAAASAGQTNRALSDKDLDRFIGLAGGDMVDPNAFKLNMANLINETIDSYETRYNTMAEWYPELKGRTFDFNRFDLDDVVDQDEYFRKLGKEYEGFILPPSKNTGISGRNDTN